MSFSIRPGHETPSTILSNSAEQSSRQEHNARRSLTILYQIIGNYLLAGRAVPENLNLRNYYAAIGDRERAENTNPTETINLRELISRNRAMLSNPTQFQLPERIRGSLGWINGQYPAETSRSTAMMLGSITPPIGTLSIGYAAQRLSTHLDRVTARTNAHNFFQEISQPHDPMDVLQRFTHTNSP